MSTEPPPADGKMGLVERLISIIKGLTFTNVFTLAMLIALLFPAYIGWKAANDPTMLALVFSQYEELDSPTDCVLSLAVPAGTEGSYFIRATVAERNREVWYVSARVRFKPDDAAMSKYCAALQGLIDYMADPESNAIPVFPDSTRHIIRQSWHRPGSANKE